MIRTDEIFLGVFIKLTKNIFVRTKEDRRMAFILIKGILKNERIF